MPSKSTKRIKPVIEEITEEPPKEMEDKVDVQPEEKSIEEAPEVEATTEKAYEETSETIHEETKEEVKTDKPAAESKRVNFKLIIVITIISALVAAFVSGGVYVYLSGLSSLKNEPEATSTPEPSPTASPEATSTPEPEENVSVSEYSVQVLNGSGAIGAASGGKDVLSKAGFTVKSVGNADDNTFDKTVVQAKSSVSATVVNEVKKALEDADYEVKVGDALSSSEKYDIIVTIGAN